MRSAACSPLRLAVALATAVLPAWGGNYPYENLISATVAYCYSKIFEDSSCCLDEKYAHGTSKHVVRRPGAGWLCNNTCFDSVKGFRGDDLVWVPDSMTCSSPRVLWIHGGSWEYGSPDTLSYGQLASKISSMSGAVVMVPDYPLAPAGNYNSILKASLDALKWLAVAPLWHLNCPSGSAPLFVAGDSAGGGTAMSLILELKRAGGWSPEGVRPTQPEVLPGGQVLAGGILYSPWTNLKCDTPDYYYNGFAKIVDTRMFTNATGGSAYVGDLMFRGHPEENLDAFTANAENYIANDTGLLTDPIASPFYAGASELGGGGIPPLLFQVGGSESILGDSLLVAQKAAFFGTHVHLDIQVGMWHDFPMYSEGCGSHKELWQAQRALNRTAQFIRRISEAKLTAQRTGLLWPPANSAPGTPSTSYIYDITRHGTEAWFPDSMRNLPIGVGIDPAYFAEYNASAGWLSSAAWLSCWMGAIAFGVCLAITSRGFTWRWPRRSTAPAVPLLQV